MQQNATTNKKQNQSVDIQNAIQQLLAHGLTLAQVWAKIALCKNLFKKGTPEFYACLGINPPPSAYEQKPTPRPKPQPKQTQQGGQPNVIIVQTPQQQRQQQSEGGFLAGHKGMLLLFGISAIALIILLTQKR